MDSCLFKHLYLLKLGLARGCKGIKACLQIPLSSSASQFSPCNAKPSIPFQGCQCTPTTFPLLGTFLPVTCTAQSCTSQSLSQPVPCVPVRAALPIGFIFSHLPLIWMYNFCLGAWICKLGCVTSAPLKPAPSRRVQLIKQIPTAN